MSGKKGILTFVVSILMLFGLTSCGATQNEKIVAARDRLCTSGEGTAVAMLNTDVASLVAEWNKSRKDTVAPAIDVTYLQEVLQLSCNQAESIVAETQLLLKNNPESDLGDQLDRIKSIESSFKKQVKNLTSTFKDANEALDMFKKAQNVAAESTFDSFQICTADMVAQNWSGAKDFCKRVVDGAPAPVVQATATGGGQ